MKRILQLPSGSTIGIDAFDRECEGCEYSNGTQCLLFARPGEIARDTWGSRLEECIEAEAEADIERRLALLEEPL